MRLVWLTLGGLSLLLGAIGIVLPVMPTVPFMLLAAFFFAKGHPPTEKWLLEHPQFGHHIIAWRERRAISRRGKLFASAAFCGSAAMGWVFAPWPWSAMPTVVGVLGAAFIWSRPDA
ncbi:MAG TPA: YbaN family protein [Allosphingosinicella sp.]|jgi:hypothetical protein